MDVPFRILSVTTHLFVERLWRTIKYECLYIQAFENEKALWHGLKAYFEWYDNERPHQGLDGQTPDEVYSGLPHWKQARLTPDVHEPSELTYLPAQAVQSMGSTSAHRLVTQGAVKPIWQGRYTS